MKIHSQILSFDGLILAGGRSHRMGTDKALLSVEGSPLWQRQERILRSTKVRDVLFSVRRDQTWLPANRIPVFDKTADLGPISGVLAGLEATKMDHLVVVAIDMPRISGAYLRKLMERCKPGLGVVPVNEKHFEPLVAIYPKKIIPLLRDAVATKEFSLQILIQRAIELKFMAPINVEPANQTLFTNWNERSNAQSDSTPRK